MIVLSKTINNELMDICTRLMREGHRIDLFSEGQLIIRKCENDIQLFTSGNMPIQDYRIMVIGEVDENLIRFLSYSKRYEGVNSFQGVIQFNRQFDAILGMNKIFPKGFTKNIIYNKGEFIFERIPAEVKKIILTPVLPFDNDTEWIRTLLEDKYGIKYFKSTISKKGNVYYPLTIIPTINFEDLDDWYSHIKYELEREI